MKQNRIILLHGFNSGPGKKEEEIKAYLKEHLMEADYELIAPQLSYEPKKAIDEINRLIEEHQTGSVFVVGTSLGGFYTNYFRTKFNFVLTNLKDYKGNKYAIHLAKEDELLNFDELRAYMEENEVNPDLYFYETDHRFGNIKEVLERMLGKGCCCETK